MTRTNNILQHISSGADSVVFNPVGTAFPQNVIDVQAALNLVKTHAINDLMNSSETYTGIVRIANLSETLAGTAPGLAVSPKNLTEALKRPVATTAVAGLTRYGTGSELDRTNASASIGINLAGLWDIIGNRAQATEAARGTATIASTAAATTATNDTSFMTPLKTKLAIDQFAITANSGADEINVGVVKIAAAPITNANLHAGMAVSPKGFLTTRATQTAIGTTRMATQAEANARAATDLAISPATMPIASTAQHGITRLSGIATSGETGFALSSHGGWMIKNQLETQALLNTGNTSTGYSVTAGNMYITGNQDEGNGNAVVKKSYLDWRLGQVSAADATVNSKGLVQLQSTVQYGNNSRALTPHGGWEIQNWVGTYYMSKTASQQTAHNLTANQMYVTGGQDTGNGAALTRLDYLNSRLNQLRVELTTGMISRSISRAYTAIVNNQLVDMGTLYFPAGSKRRAGTITLPVLYSNATDYYKIYITVSTSDGVGDETYILANSTNKGGYQTTNDEIMFTPTFSFTCSAGCQWVNVKARAEFLGGSGFAWKPGALVMHMCETQ